MSLKDTLIGLFIILLWGMNFVVIVWGLSDLPPLLLGASRFILVAVLGSLFIRPPGIPWGWLCLYALTINVGQFAFLFWAMNVGMSAGLASLVLQSQAIFSVVFAVMLLQEKISSGQILALVISTCGLIIIANSLNNQTITAIGFGLTIVAASCWALGNIVTRKIANKGYRAGLGLVVWSSWFAIPPLLAASLLLEGKENIVTGLTGLNWNTFGALLYLSVGASIIGYGLWSKLLAKYPAAKVSPLTLGVPVVGLGCAALFLQESISDQQLIGVIVVLSGLALNSFHKTIIQKLNKLTARTT